MKVLMLAHSFLSTHPRAGEPTGFKEAYQDGRKIHTIRANAKGYYKDGDTVSVRQWTGRPRASKQVEIGVSTIGLEPMAMNAITGRIDLCSVNGSFVDPVTIAHNDGLHLGTFYDWFFPRGRGAFRGLFEGDILHFTEFRYGHNKGSREERSS